MFVDAQSLESAAGSLTQVGDRLLRAWPEQQRFNDVGDPRIQATMFFDNDVIYAAAVPIILNAARTMQANHRGYGGRKVRDQGTWDSPVMRLLTLRALSFVCFARKVAAAYVVDRWANVMLHEEYSSPHSHYDADVAVVYSLDPGDVAPSIAISGQLEIIDSRIPYCCSTRPEHPTRGIMPVMHPGAMLIFPAAFLHCVTPYEGQRPRITLAWNVTLAPPPEGLHDPTKPRPGAFGLEQPTR